MPGRWQLILVHAVLYAARFPLHSADSDISDILPMLGPRSEVDVVGLLDRSQGVGQHNFIYFVRPFFESLLTQYAAVHGDFARSTVITFARDVTVAYDTISDPDAAVSKCQLFGASSALWDRVAFVSDATVWTGTNLTGALRHAVDVLERGHDNRPNATQVNKSQYDEDVIC